jgi:hypothetical protein
VFFKMTQRGNDLSRSLPPGVIVAARSTNFRGEEASLMKKLRFLISLMTRENDYQLEQAASAQQAGASHGIDVQILFAEQRLQHPRHTSPQDHSSGFRSATERHYLRARRRAVSAAGGSGSGGGGNPMGHSQPQRRLPPRAPQVFCPADFLDHRRPK